MSTFKLGPNQEKWLKALESGRYKKTTGTLRNNDGHCCLGVGCRIFRIKGREQSDGRWSYEGKMGVAPSSLMNLLALRSPLGSFLDMRIDGKVCLTELNDDKNEEMSFKDIAYLVRSNPEKVFTKSL